MKHKYFLIIKDRIMNTKQIILTLIAIVLLQFANAQEIKLTLPLGHTSDVNTAVYSPDGKTIVTSSKDKTAKIWDSQTGKLLHTLKGHTKNLAYACYGQDGKIIATVDIDRVSKEWETKTGKLLSTSKFSNYSVLSATNSPDGKYIIEKSISPSIKDKETGKILCWLKGHTESVNFINYSPDGKTIVTASKDNTAKIWDSKTGKLLYTLGENISGLHYVTYSPDGKNIVTVQDNGTTIIWNGKTGKLLHTLTLKCTWRLSSKPAIFSPDGKNIAILSTRDTVTIWNSETGELLHTLKGFKFIREVNYSPDGKNIATTSDLGTVVKIWDTKTGKLLHTLKGFKLIREVNYSPDGKNIAISLVKKVKIYDSKTGKLLHALKGFISDYSPDGKSIAILGFSKSGSTVKIWSVDTKKILFNVEGGEEVLLSVIYSPDRKNIAALGFPKFGSIVKIWDIQTGKLLHTLVHANYIKSFDYDNEGKTILTRTDNTIGIWDIQTGKLLYSLKEHSISTIISHRLSSNYSPDGKMIIIASSDGGIIIRDTKTGKLLVQQYLFENNEYVTLSPDGYFDGTPEALKQLYFVKGLDIIPLGAYYEQFYRPSLWERIMNEEEIEKPTMNFADQKPLPSIKVTNPTTGKIEFRGVSKVDLSTSVKEFNLEFNVTDNGGGINEVRIFQNGKLVNSKMESVNEKDKQISHSFKLSLLQGENNIKVTAFNNERTEKSETVVIEYTGKIQEPAKLYVLAIGLNEYKKSTYNLNYAVPDANAFTQAIKQGAKDIFTEVNITSLQNNQATKANITKAFNEIKAKAKQSDVFIFYYAGHGSMSVVDEGKQSMFFLIPYDVTNLYSADVLKTYGISSAQLQDFSKNIAAQKQLFVLDACQSGGALDLIASRGALEERAMAILARSTGTYWLTASGSEQLAGEFGALGHGVFTYAILQGLSGKADAQKDSKVSVKELSFYIESEVPILSEKYKGKEQFPVTYGFGQDFPVVLSGKYTVNSAGEPQIKPQGKYANYSIEELKKMMKEAADNMDYDKASEIKKAIEKR